MLTTVLASVILLQAEKQQDFKFPVMTIAQYGKWLGEQRGLPVTVRPEVEDRMVYINVKDKTVAELTALVETATGVHVLDKNGMLTFEKAPADAAADLADEFRYWEKNFNAQFSTDFKADDLERAIVESQRLNKLMAENFDNGTYQQLEKLNRTDPSSVFLAEFIQKLGVRGIQTLPQFQRVVFSTSPTRLQRAWPFDPGAEIAKLNERIALKNQIHDRLEAGMSQEDRNSISYYGSELFRGYARQEPVAAALVVAQRQNGAISFELQLFSEQGDQVMRSNKYLSGYYDAERFSEITSTIDFTGVEEKVQLTDQELEELSLDSLLYYGAVSGAREFRPSDIDWLCTVDQGYPLSPVYSRLLDRACEITGNQTVAFISAPAYRAERDNTVSMSDICMFLFSGIEDYGKPIAKNQLVVRKPDAARVLFGTGDLPRKPLGQAARALKKQGVLTIDILADAIKQVPDDEVAARVATALLALSGQGAGYMSLQPREWPMFLVRAYGDLTPAMRRQVWTEPGLQLPVNNSPGSIRNRFQEMLNIAPVDLGVSRSGNMIRMGRSDDSGWPPSVPDTQWIREQTVFLARPESQPFVLGLTASREDKFLTQRSYQGWTDRQTRSLEEMASEMIFQEQAESQGQNYFKLDGVAPCRQVNLALTVTFGQFPPMIVEFGFLESPVTKVFPIKDLPEDTKKKLDAEVERLRKEYGTINFGSPGRGSSPPPQP